MPEDIKFKRFGKYLILDHLADGGMAKICRARYLGEQGDKIVAIKMIRPQHTQNESFKAMFMDEVRVSFGLQHPNIVQTYDYGHCNGQFYVAMEYCDGQNIRNYINKLKVGGYTFPIDISTYVISQACQGLHYAHTMTDKLTGKYLKIIHRDISPHNIMLTYDGSVKIIDFGIAKTDFNSEVTQAGSIKGKLSYMAPEYLEGGGLDARYDQFALGITLWEMLCAKKLFEASNDMAILKEIQKCEIPPPSTINPKVPKELDDIVLKALSKSKDARFNDVNEMNKALTKFLYQYRPEFNATDTAYFAKNLFKEQIKKDREKFFSYGKIDITPYLNQTKEKEHTEVKKMTSYTRHTTFEMDKEIFTNKKSSNSSIELEQLSHRKKSIPKEVTKNFTNIKKYQQEQTRIASKKPLIRRPILAFTSIVLIVFLVMDMREESSFVKGTIKNIQNEKEKILSKKRVTASSMGYITLLNFDRYNQTAFLNGIKTEVNFLKQIQVPLDEEFTLRVETPEKQHYVITTEIPSSENEKNISVPNMPSAIYGYLITSTPCLAGGTLSFSLFGEKRTESLPLEHSIPFPLKRNNGGHRQASSYEILLTRSDGVKKNKVIRIRYADETIDLCKL